MKIETITIDCVVNHKSVNFIALIDKEQLHIFAGIKTSKYVLKLYSFDISTVLVTLRKFKNEGCYDVPTFVNKQYNRLFKDLDYIPDMLIIILLTGYILGISDEALKSDVIKYLNFVVYSDTYGNLEDLLAKIINELSL